eukprot:CAMPEP_0174846854 /NCGR_PEP_ID=MMETSP1114-20130205/12559_1 /TAXON_ID=312471 /ORGANISM="Neobodo designis, Strain CCAP 1951/1" /LENGTH=332 /DNA_ID=CAMNT_0016081125 /DNA_START=29 /DNA_END=1023 /DNA_ORIENTATION=+
MSDQNAARTRSIRSYLLQRAVAGDGHAPNEALMRDAVERLHHAAITEFLTADDGFLLTLDHKALVAPGFDRVKRCRAEAADAIAALVPHTKCAVTKQAFNTTPPAALTAPTTIAVPPANPPKSESSVKPEPGAKAESQAEPATSTKPEPPTTPEAFLDAAKRAVAAMPLLADPPPSNEKPRSALIAPAVLAAVVEGAQVLTTYLGGTSGFNPARLGVSIHLLDVVMPVAEGRALIETLCFVAAARLAGTRRYAGENPEVRAAVDQAAAALRSQARAVDERCAMVGRPSALSSWVAHGQLDGWLGALHDDTGAPVVNPEIARLLIDGELPAAA